MARILVVDDNNDIAESVRIHLEKLGYQVMVCNNGCDGLAMAQKELPDLIILDLMLPGMDGYKITSALKSDEKYKNIPIIMFTARTEDLERIMGEQLGVDAHIIKPFDSKELVSKIRKLLKEEVN
jgi:DNA-binding response OmpR family regulator